MTPPPGQNAAHELLCAIQALSPDTASPREIRDITARARRLRRVDLLPSWVLSTSRQPARAPRPAASRTAHDPAPVLEAKAAASGIPASVLREVYCREFTSPTVHVPPPSQSRECCAHARVNTFIRLSQGDLGARTDDVDLLLMLSQSSAR